MNYLTAGRFVDLTVLYEKDSSKIGIAISTQLFLDIRSINT